MGHSLMPAWKANFLADLTVTICTYSLLPWQHQCKYKCSEHCPCVTCLLESILHEQGATPLKGSLYQDQCFIAVECSLMHASLCVCALIVFWEDIKE